MSGEGAKLPTSPCAQVGKGEGNTNIFSIKGQGKGEEKCPKKKHQRLVDVTKDPKVQEKENLPLTLNHK